MITVNEEVDEFLKKTIGKTKAEFAQVYVPKRWEGRDVLICLLPEKKHVIGMDFAKGKTRQ